MAFLEDINRAYYRDFSYARVDGLLVKILWWHFVVLLLGTLFIYYFQPASFYPSPFSWRILSTFDVIFSIGAALLAALIPTILRGRLKNHYHYRLVMLAAYMLFSFLLILVSGGSTEMHFYLFGIWALLTLYCDWRLIWIGFALMLVHHVVLNFTISQWLFQYGENNLALLAYVLFTLPAAIFTARIAQNGRRAVVAMAEANKFIQSKVGQSPLP